MERSEAIDEEALGQDTASRETDLPAQFRTGVDMA